jgi:Putative aminopeptidase
VPDAEKRDGKRRVLEALQSEYRQLRQGPWAGFAGYDRWFSRPLGNAHLGSVATYTTWVPVFRQLFEESAGDFGRFYLKVGELAALDRIERQAFLVRRGKRLIGDETLTPAVPARDDATPPASGREAATGDVPAGDQAVTVPAAGQVHAREQSTGATIRTYR